MSSPSSKVLGSSDTLYMTAKEAARALDVSVSTLYTYVSRKGIRAYKARGGRSSRYLRSDIERIRGGLPLPSLQDVAAGWTVSSSITLLTEAGSFYRGVSAVHLAQSASLEDVCRLLWDCEDFDPFESPVPAAPSDLAPLLDACASYPMIDRMAMLLPMMESGDRDAKDRSKQRFLRSGVHVMRWLAAVMLRQPTPAAVPLHRYIANLTRCSPALEDAVRRVLVLAADQGLHPATCVVRAAASTGATPYRCVAAGLAVTRGWRLPTVRTETFTRLMDEIVAADDPAEVVRTRWRMHAEVPGFGFSPFDAPDPRALALWDALNMLLATDPVFPAFKRAIDSARELTGKEPDFALLAAFVNRRVGAEPDFNLIGLARIAGWIAHAWEQQADQPPMRWKLNYTGALPA